MPIFIVTRCFLREGKQPYILNGGLVRFKSELGLELLERFGPPLESPSAEPCSSSTSSEPAAKMSKKKKDVVPYDDLIRSHPKISEITHGLFLGNIHASSDPKLLASYGITHVVNCTASASNEFPDYLTYLRIPARDAPSQNLSQYFEEARRFISKAIDEEKGAVLVHCHAGISRSSTIVLAYLISEEGLSLNTAFDLVQKRRSIVAPNFSFMGQLSDYARAIHEPLPAPPPPVHQLGGATADSVERKLQEMKEA